MSFTEAQKDQIRAVMGCPKLFAQTNSYLETAIQAVENLLTIDGGATETAVKAILAKITAIETQIDINSNLMLATEVTGEIKYDAVRNDAALRKVGRGYIHQLSIRFSMDPQTDYFGPAAIAGYNNLKFNDRQ